jgi:hypothetical protein
MSRDRLARRIATALVHRAARVLPRRRAEWARAMIVEVEHIPNDLVALRWSFGCALASYRERMSIMSSSNFSIARWLLGVEALVCLGPLTLMWVAAMYIVLATPSSGAAIVIPTVIGTLGPIALLLALYGAAVRRSVASGTFAMLAFGFAALALFQILKPDAAWFAFHWRVWMLNSVLPCVACAHFAVLARPQTPDALRPA